MTLHVVKPGDQISIGDQILSASTAIKKSPMILKPVVEGVRDIHCQDAFIYDDNPPGTTFDAKGFEITVKAAQALNNGIEFELPEAEEEKFIVRATITGDPTWFSVLGTTTEGGRYQLQYSDRDLGKLTSIILDADFTQPATIYIDVAADLMKQEKRVPATIDKLRAKGNVTLADMALIDNHDSITPVKRTMPKKKKILPVPKAAPPPIVPAASAKEPAGRKHPVAVAVNSVITPFTTLKLMAGASLAPAIYRDHVGVAGQVPDHMNWCPEPDIPKPVVSVTLKNPGLFVDSLRDLPVGGEIYVPPGMSLGNQKIPIECSGTKHKKKYIRFGGMFDKNPVNFQIKSDANDLVFHEVNAPTANFQISGERNFVIRSIINKANVKSVGSLSPLDNEFHRVIVKAKNNTGVIGMIDPAFTNRKSRADSYRTTISFCEFHDLTGPPKKAISGVSSMDHSRPHTGNLIQYCLIKGCVDENISIKYEGAALLGCVFLPKGPGHISLRSTAHTKILSCVVYGGTQKGIIVHGHNHDILYNLIHLAHGRGLMVGVKQMLPWAAYKEKGLLEQRRAMTKSRVRYNFWAGPDMQHWLFTEGANKATACSSDNDVSDNFYLADNNLTYHDQNEGRKEPGATMTEAQWNAKNPLGLKKLQHFGFTHDKPLVIPGETVCMEEFRGKRRTAYMPQHFIGESGSIIRLS